MKRSVYILFMFCLFCCVNFKQTRTEDVYCGTHMEDRDEGEESGVKWEWGERVRRREAVIIYVTHMVMYYLAIWHVFLFIYFFLLPKKYTNEETTFHLGQSAKRSSTKRSSRSEEEERNYKHVVPSTLVQYQRSNSIKKKDESKERLTFVNKTFFFVFILCSHLIIWTKSQLSMGINDCCCSC
jgi:hypothetical protein